MTEMTEFDRLRVRVANAALEVARNVKDRGFDYEGRIKHGSSSASAERLVRYVYTNPTNDQRVLTTYDIRDEEHPRYSVRVHFDISATEMPTSQDRGDFEAPRRMLLQLHLSELGLHHQRSSGVQHVSTTPDSHTHTFHFSDVRNPARGGTIVFSYETPGHPGYYYLEVEEPLP